MRILMILFCSVFLFTGSMAGQHNIDFKISNYEHDTIVIGYHVLDKQLVLDTLVSSNMGEFEYQSEEDLPGGVYLLLFHPGDRYIQFLVNGYEKTFSVHVDADNPEQISFEGSQDNISFQEYIAMLAKYRPEADSLNRKLAQAEEGTESYLALRRKINRIDSMVTQQQDAIISNAPNSTAALLIKANRPVPTGDFEETENSAMARYLYFREHYFDNLELDNPVLLRTPVMFQKVDYYITKLTPNHPDSIITAIDRILGLMDGCDENFKYYLSHFLNTYAGSKIVGYDAIYVHLADNYYAQGMAPWVDEENLQKIIDNASKIRPVLIGKTGPDITVYDEFENPVSISDIDYEYLILLFWSPDCSHCKKTMPQFIEFDKRWRDRGVKTFAICTKHKEKVADCWEYVNEKDMLGFINGADKYHRSRFKLKYNVQTTPKVFVLDKNRKILMKNVGAEQLDQVMEEVLKMQAAEPVPE